jgi:hypothetical protein
MNDLRFDVYGKRIAVQRAGTGWTCFLLGSDGKCRPAHDLVIPAFVAEDGAPDGWHDHSDRLRARTGISHAPTNCWICSAGLTCRDGLRRRSGRPRQVAFGLAGN